MVLENIGAPIVTGPCSSLFLGFSMSGLLTSTLVIGYSGL
jgi:hypothetical protein